jgi:hypothetical protein|tara:strand:+ start:816 stop:1295 length:480 start_codon:yes stop_codon:yes gene_type:complete
MALVQLPQVRMGHDEHIVPLTYDHLTRIKLKKENSDFVDVIPNYIDYVWDHAAVGTSWAGIGRGKVIAAFGIRPFWDGVSEMWLIPGQEIDRHAISVIRAARQLSDAAIGDYSIKRLQMCVNVNNDTAFRFAKALRFEVESVMRKYGPDGADYYMMVRF